jgi:hypothetical protein
MGQPRHRQFFKPSLQPVPDSPVPDSPPDGGAGRRKTREVRCQCRVCGSHAFAVLGVSLSGQCGNCKSFDLTPLE